MTVSMSKTPAPVVAAGFASLLIVLLAALFIGGFALGWFDATPPPFNDVPSHVLMPIDGQLYSF
jgi:hypothetical protein